MFTSLKRLNPLQASLLLIFATTLLRLFASSQIGLSVDEAHYALYGQYLALSYFDHPPMIGWLQALILPFSHSDLAMRLMPISLFAATSLVLYRVTLVLFPNETPWIGFVSVALLQSGIMFQLIGMAMLPDTPLLLLGLLVLWTLQRIAIAGQTRNWLWLGVLLGLAALSKYTAVTLVFTVVLAVIFNKKWHQLLTPWPWLAVIFGGILILPILYWNYQHDWISFTYQLKHGTGKPHWEALRFGLSQAAQLLAYGPGIMIFGAIAIVSALKSNRDASTWLCLSLALPILVLFGWGGGYEMTLPHWTALGWAGLAPLTARWLVHHRQWLSVRLGVGLALTYSAILIALIFSEFITPWLPFKENANPLRDLYGWSQAAKKATQLQQEMLAADPSNPPLLFTDNWTYGSRLAWYTQNLVAQAPVTVQILDQRYDQFDIWYGSPQDQARGVLVLWPDQNAQPAVGGVAQFTHCELRDRLPILTHGNLVSTFSFYACNGFKN